MMRSSVFKQNKIYFGIAWLLLFATWYFLRADGYASSSTAFYVTVIKIADLALMVCICNYVLIPKFFYKKKYVLFVCFFMFLVVLSSLAKMNILGRIMNNAFLLDWSHGWKIKIYDNIIPHVFLVIAGAAIKLMIDYTVMQKRMLDLAREKAEAELEFLKQQINPHFLFNSLNTVYFQIDKSNTVARETLHQFSEMLRYQLYETGGAAIPIEKEIKYLEEYISLQKLRKDDQYKVNLSIAENVKGFFIEPFLLIPFVENCFKHISHYADQENYIKVEITCENGVFYFSAENTAEESISDKQGTGIGLANVKRRLELLYPGRRTLQIEKRDNKYLVQLQLKINYHG
ncbi:MAG: histidine kinase [Rhizobacter sp.]|nr:histidine kinase [Ferruginibacter sp.]